MSASHPSEAEGRTPRHAPACVSCLIPLNPEPGGTAGVAYRPCPQHPNAPIFYQTVFATPERGAGTPMLSIDDLRRLRELAEREECLADEAYVNDDDPYSLGRSEEHAKTAALLNRLAARSPAPSDEATITEAEQALTDIARALSVEPTGTVHNRVAADVADDCIREIVQLRGPRAAPSVEARDAALPVFGMPLDENHPLALEAGEPRIIEHSFGIAALLPPEKT